MPPLLILAAGLVLLVVAAEALVRGASRLSLAAGLSRLVVGLVVVSLGTSAPEAAVTVGAAWQGRTDLAVANIVGSNTFNVLFILGLSAIVTPLAVGRRLVRIDIPVMLGMSLLFVALVLDGGIGRIDGAILLLLALAYIVMNVRLGRNEAAAPLADDPRPLETQRSTTGMRALVIAVLLTLVGIGGLVIGARLAVDGASDLARSIGMSDLVIGLTVVAAGTSLPEVSTSVMAAIRGERDIAVGNIVGSCTLNIAFILGLAGSIAPVRLGVSPAMLAFDLPVMVAAAAVIVPIVFTGHLVARWEGVLFLGFYIAYVTQLLLNAAVHPAAPRFGFALRWFVIPLVVIVLTAAVVHELRQRARARPRKG